MRFISLLLLTALGLQGAITYHNSASTPADNGTNTATTTAVTPPASMTTGDIAVIIAQTKSASATYAMSETSGQTWNALTACDGPASSFQIFWARFNGTWGADPSVAFTGNAQFTTVVMHVFRPTDTGKQWAVDGSQTCTSYAAPSTPFTVTITGHMTGQNSTVTIGVWSSQDDNTWGSLSGTGWTATGTAQYRNLGGQDGSMTFAHNIQTTTVTLNNVSQNQATLGGDAGSTVIVTFYEFDPPATSIKSPIMRGRLGPI